MSRRAGWIDSSRTDAELPRGLRIYAVGDIHGRFDLLRILYAKIMADLARAPPRESVEIFLGDYIDRGPHSAEVVEWLIAEAPATGRRICLMGNHEDILLGALGGAEGMPLWLMNGGAATLLSYRVTPPFENNEESIAEARRSFLPVLPQRHRDFFGTLPRIVEFGPYIFVHAGLRPGVSLDHQDPEDLVWIREPFLTSTADFGRLVVHGHTPVHSPEILANRINIDTGAVFSGRLTCIVLEADAYRLLQADDCLPHLMG